MTENEAIEYLKSSKRKSNMLGILPGSDIGNTIHARGHVLDLR